jgi:hypothetical protein
MGGGQPVALFGGGIELRVGHAKQIEESFLQERINGHAAHHFDDAHIGVDVSSTARFAEAGGVGEDLRDGQVGGLAGRGRREEKDLNCRRQAAHTVTQGDHTSLMQSTTL